MVGSLKKLCIVLSLFSICLTLSSLILYLLGDMGSAARIVLSAGVLLSLGADGTRLAINWFETRADRVLCYSRLAWDVFAFSLIAL